MEKSISPTELNDLASNHRRNTDLPFITNAAFIKIDELKTFISRAKSKHPTCDTLQINFIRYPLSADQDTLLVAGNNLSQVSLMFVPVRTISPIPWVVENLKDQNNETFTLSINEPGISDVGINGLCPPKGNCP